MDFKQFVMNQDSNRTINHSAGWGACAVGDFIKETDYLKNANVPLEEYMFHLENEPCASEIKEIIGSTQLFNALNDRGHVPGKKGVVLLTYGSIQDYYKGNLSL